jgi:hypothetical protein
MEKKPYPIPEEVVRSFDAVVIALNEMTQEAADIKQKFGDRSKLLEKKIAHINAVRSLYNEAKSYIEDLIKKNSHLGIKMIGTEILLLQLQTGMKFGDAAKVLGYQFSKEHIEAQEKLDDLLKEVTKPVKFDL